MKKTMRSVFYVLLAAMFLLLVTCCGQQNLEKNVAIDSEQDKKSEAAIEIGETPAEYEEFENYVYMLNHNFASAGINNGCSSWDDPTTLPQSFYVLFYVYNSHNNPAYAEWEKDISNFDSDGNGHLPANMLEDYILKYFDIPLSLLRDPNGDAPQQNGEYIIAGVGGVFPLVSVDKVVESGEKSEIYYTLYYEDTTVDGEFVKEFYGSGTLTVKKNSEDVKFLSNNVAFAK